MKELIGIFLSIVILIVTVAWATMCIHQDLINIMKEIKEELLKQASN